MNARLVYDGDCGFCAWWVRYWQRLTGGQVEYRTYQDVAHEHPDISQEQFANAIQYFGEDGEHQSGAAASFRTLRHADSRSLSWWCYQNLPGFDFITEVAYQFIARHRDWFYKPSKLLWGKERYPERFDQLSWLFLRLLGLIYLSAFISFAVQAMGLIGSNGIVPLADYTQAIVQQYGNESYWLKPMLFWFNQSDLYIQFVSWSGVVLSLLVVANRLVVPSLILLFSAYLSIVGGTQVFMNFQWDIMLLEAGFLAIFLPGSIKVGSRIIPWLYRWFVFRFVFMGGVVKLTSGDSAWWDFTALNYHFETQPIPTLLGWYAHQLPEWFLKFSVVGVFWLELLIPFLIFLPRNLRIFAAYNIILLQVVILLTGNYNFFNLLTICITLFLFDDRHLQYCLRGRWLTDVNSVAYYLPMPTWRNVMLLSLAALSIWVATVKMTRVITGNRLPDWVNAPASVVDRFHLVNHYGPFAVMTKRRTEIIFEGSKDGEHWYEYRMHYKPNELDNISLWIIPHQPRLDWQMWFAALGNVQRNQWVYSTAIGLLKDSEPVKAFFEVNPFPDEPPKYVRSVGWDYHFTNFEEKAETGNWWKREYLGLYSKPIYLR